MVTHRCPLWRYTAALYLYSAGFLAAPHLVAHRVNKRCRDEGNGAVVQQAHAQAAAGSRR